MKTRHFIRIHIRTYVRGVWVRMRDLYHSRIYMRIYTNAEIKIHIKYLCVSCERSLQGIEAEVLYTYLHNDFRLEIHAVAHNILFSFIRTERDTLINKILFDKKANTYTHTLTHADQMQTGWL